MKDKENFPEPERFLPERHLKKFGMDPDQREYTNRGANVDPSELVFGFGRRRVASGGWCASYANPEMILAESVQDGT